MKKGFTLVELIVVIIIIAILAAIAIPQFMRMQERAKASAARAKLDVIRKAEKIYRAINEVYTSNFSNLSGDVPEVNNLNDSEWRFTLNNVSNTTFTAIATRQRGVYTNRIITINENGDIGGNHPTITGSW